MLPGAAQRLLHLETAPQAGLDALDERHGTVRDEALVDPAPASEGSGSEPRRGTRRTRPSGAPDPLPPPHPQTESCCQPPRTALGEQLLLLTLLLPPAGLIGLLVMHAVERRPGGADSRPGRVSSSDLSWQSSAQARARRLRRPSADTHNSAG